MTVPIKIYESEEHPNLSISTLTVAELIGVLSRFDGNLPVVTSWEGQQIKLTEDRIVVTKFPYTGWQKKDVNKISVLEFDADNNNEYD
jgi:hypothetical protein